MNRLPVRHRGGLSAALVLIFAVLPNASSAASVHGATPFVAAFQSQSLLVFGAWVLALLLGLVLGWVWHRAQGAPPPPPVDPLAGITSPALICDAQGGLLRANAAAERMLTVVTRPGESLLPPGLAARAGRCLENGLADSTLESAVGNLWVCWLVEPCGEPGQVRVLLLDFTARRRRDEELIRERNSAREAHRSTGEFVSTLSHDIRVPMNGVLGMANLLVETQLSPQQAELARAVVQSAENVITLTDELLDLAKIEAGKLEISPHPCEIAVLLEDLLRAQASRSTEKRLDLACAVDPGVPSLVMVDPVRVRQILGNLVNNALKFTERGEVIVRAWLEATTTTESELRFSVRDTGIGIDPEKSAILFQAFTQADASTFRTYGGTGLGLFTCKQLAALMHGRVWFESEPGRGSTFYVALPYRRVPDAAHSPVALPHVQLQGKTVLLVEDSVTLGKIIGDWLGRWGAKVVTFPTGDEALTWVRGGGHCLLAIVDLDLPGTTPLALLHALGQLRSAPRRLAMATRPPEPNPALAGIEVLLKPLGASALLECLRRAPRPAAPTPTRLSINTSTTAHAAASAAPATSNVSSLHPLTPPVTAPAATGSSATGSGATKPSGPAPRVLVADDDVVNQKVMRTYIERFGCKVRVVSNGAEALEAIAKERPDLVFLDIMMPVLDGLQAVRAIRQREADAATAGGTKDHLPVVAITAKVMPSDRDAGLAAGFDDYATKPVNAARLRESIAKFIPAFAAQAAATPAPTSENAATAPAPAPAAPVSAVAAHAEPVLIDRARIEELASGDAETMREIVTLYFQKMEALLAELTPELELPAMGDARRLAHTGAGSSGTCGMARTQAAFRRVEHFIEARNLTAARSGLSEIRAALESSRQAAESLLHPA